MIRSATVGMLILALSGAKVYSADIAGKVLSPPLKTYDTQDSKTPGTVVEDGKAKMVIVVDSSTNRRFFETNLKRAVEELNKCIKARTGVELEVVDSKTYKSGKAIFIGNSPAAANAGFEFNDLKPEHFRTISKNGNLAIIGMDAEEITLHGPNGQAVKEEMHSRGTLFGVYDFLERYLGVRWYFPGELGTIVSQNRNLIIDPCNYEDGPVFLRRHPWTESLNNDRAFASKWRYGEWIGTGNHSHDKWAKIFPGKPELFALKKDGTREMTYFGGQLDYTNPEVLALELERLKRFYAGDKAKLWHMREPRNSYFIEFPCDCMSDSQSPAFLAYLASYKGTNPGRDLYSKLIHQFYSDIAAESEKLWLEKYMLFGAYSKYSLPSKDVRYRKNMIAEVCIMDGMAFHKEPEKYKFWLDVLKQYKDLTGNKPFFWHYPCWPQESTSAPLLFPHLVNRWHRDAKDIASGAFLCGLVRNMPKDHLNAYLWMKSMWNPDFDVQAALDEYYVNCYGAAAPVMKQYYDLMISRWENTIWNLPSGKSGGLPLDKLYKETYPPEVREQLKKLEAKALTLVSGDSAYYKRIKSVVDAQKDFYLEAELYELIGRGSILYASPGTPGKIDGKLDDACWKNIGMQMRDRTTGNDVSLKSIVRMCYDKRNLYIACDFDEPSMNRLKANSKKHDDAIWSDDGIEIFISPKQYPDHYVQIVINTNGISYDGWKEAEAVFTQFKDFKITSSVNKNKNGYTMEVAIPWQELGISAPEAGTSMRANITRNRTTSGNGNEIFAFSPTLKQSNHNTKYFGTVIFTNNDPLCEDFGHDMKIKWAPHALGKGSDCDAYATLTDKGTFSTLKAKMSKGKHVANIIANPGIWIKKGDLIEIRYRGPRAPYYGRLELVFKLQAKDKTEKSSWKADNRINKDEWRTFVVDPFKLCQLNAPEARLLYLAIHLASKQGAENSMDIDYIRISPYTSANVK